MQIQVLSYQQDHNITTEGTGKIKTPDHQGKVYFKINNYSKSVNPVIDETMIDKFTREQIHKIKSRYSNEISKYLPNKYLDPMIGETNGYQIYRYDLFEIVTKTSYKVYLIPKESYLNNIDEFKNHLIYIGECYPEDFIYV